MQYLYSVMKFNLSNWSSHVFIYILLTNPSMPGNRNKYNSKSDTYFWGIHGFTELLIWDKYFYI